MEMKNSIDTIIDAQLCSKEGRVADKDATPTSLASKASFESMESSESLQSADSIESIGSMEDEDGIDADLAMIRALIVAEEKAVTLQASQERIQEVAAAQERILKSSQRWGELDRISREEIAARRKNRAARANLSCETARPDTSVDLDQFRETERAEGRPSTKAVEDVSSSKKTGSGFAGRARFFWSRKGSSSRGTLVEDDPIADDLSDRQGSQSANEDQAVAMVGTSEEDSLVEQLLKLVNVSALEDSLQNELGFWTRACLRARRFRVSRTVELLESYSVLKKALENDAAENTIPAQKLLESGVIQFLQHATDAQGRGLILVTMRAHDPRRWNGRVFLHALHAVATSAIRNFPVLQVLGFRVLLDMSGASASNFDNKLPKILAESLNDKLPLRYCNIVLINPPLFFSTIFRVAWLFLKGKMRARLERVRVDLRPGVVSRSNPLVQIIPMSHLPVQLGGGLDRESISITGALAELGVCPQLL